MNTKRQVVLSILFVAVAGAVVLGYASLGEDDTRENERAGGHDHGAMISAGEGSMPVRLDKASARRIGVTYATAVRKSLERRVSTVATVTYDETRLVNVNPKIHGWVEHLYVDFTGAPVRRGQPLLDIYSPELVSAQEELILARNLVDEASAEPGSRAAEKSMQLVESARRRLAYWDIPPDQIDRIEDTRAPQKTMTLRAPTSGIVVEKDVLEGTRVMPGMNLYTIADLSVVWVEGEVFEKDLSLVKEGQQADVLLEAYPGEPFAGMITYVYPTVSLEARTGRIRVELSNPDIRLKPGMYARIELEAGSVEALVVPRTAVHATGARSYVFVSGEEGVLTAREVTTGLVSGQEIEILDGLEEGERLVSSANFLIDAESSMGSAIRAMPGMEMDDGTIEAEEPEMDGSGHSSGR